jgi:hypothetical protein
MHSLFDRQGICLEIRFGKIVLSFPRELDWHLEINQKTMHDLNPNYKSSFFDPFGAGEEALYFESELSHLGDLKRPIKVFMRLLPDKSGVMMKVVYGAFQMREVILEEKVSQVKISIETFRDFNDLLMAMAN